MKTRFNNKEIWVSANGSRKKIESMDTMHILNTLAMFNNKPANTLAMLINDIETGAFESTIWFDNVTAEDNKQSLLNVTSMDSNKLIDYAWNSPVARAMREALQERGVNVDVALSILAI